MELGIYKDPNSGQELPLTVAVELGYVSVTEEERSVIETKTTTIKVHEPIVAPIESRKKPADTTTYIAPPDGIKFKEAVENGLIDLKSNTFTEPITKIQMPLDDAVKQGYLIIPEGGVSVTITEGGTSQTQQVTTSSITSKQTTSSGIPFNEAIDSGIVDVVNNTFKDPSSGVVMDLNIAIERGLVDATIESSQDYHFQ
ncbi:unnamed protein product [Owenia fusiformis]|uniref:Uncharacterized protein n=1 Tax=Owenia fusiformis TaxID=6347 RepID=A0A8S4Q787_OWEFU|nr:unnamed protein product [Owenia fusiformis]